MASNASTNPVKTSLEAVSAFYERRWLAGYFVQRQLSRSYRNSYLGVAWLILSPLLMVALYTLVFSRIIGLEFMEGTGVANYGLYIYCGLLPFMAFSATVNGSSGSIRANSMLVRRVVFPLEVLPFSTAAIALVNQLFGLGVIVVLVALVERQLHWTILLLPLILIPQLLFVMGLAYLVAVVGAYLPDLREVLGAVVRAMFFVTPIIWPPERVPEDLRFIVDLNPVAYLVVAYRGLILEGRIPEPVPLLVFTLFTGALLVVGFVFFVQAKRNFADLI